MALADRGHTDTHTHTHTQSKYCNPPAHARRALMMVYFTKHIALNHIQFTQNQNITGKKLRF